MQNYGVQNSKLLEVLQNHRSIRHYLVKKISDEDITRILLSAQAAPSSSHGQAYSIICVTDPIKKKQLADYAGGQQHVENCSHFFVFCADLYRLSKIANNASIDLEESLDSTEMFLIATIDATLAAQNTAVASEALGLGIVYIGGIRNNPYEVSQLLNLPNRVYPIFGMCIGYPDPKSIPDKKPRLPLQAQIFENEYKSYDETSAFIKEYDETMKKYFLNRTNGQRNETWSELITDKRKIPRRLNIRTFLKDKGFPLK